jgi:hypothetical protein
MNNLKIINIICEIDNGYDKYVLKIAYDNSDLKSHH